MPNAEDLKKIKEFTTQNALLGTHGLRCQCRGMSDRVASVVSKVARAVGNGTVGGKKVDFTQEDIQVLQDCCAVAAPGSSVRYQFDTVLTRYSEA